ncbi:MAG: hypothetical protein IMX02_11480 [Limnochordaceae bacterium]|nr:hypothetical protein [Limnochordaceae bacterium]
MGAVASKAAGKSPVWLAATVATVAVIGVLGWPAMAQDKPFTLTQTVPRDGARQAYVRLDMGAGELRVSGGAAGLLEGRFEYRPEHWRPEVTHRTYGSRADVRITQPPLWRWPWTLDVHNVWAIRLNDDVPTELDVRLGAGGSRLHLGNVTLSRLDVRVGAGEVTLDLRGPWRQDLSGYVHGGVGRLTVRLPDQVGVRVDVSKGLGRVEARGLRQEGDHSFLNEWFGKAPVNIHLQVDAGVGEIVLESGSDGATA